MVRDLPTLDPTTVMLIATVLLILTPILRVMVSMYIFAAEGDWKYVGITAVVLLVILATIACGAFGLT